MYTRIIKECAQYALFDRQGVNGDYQIWNMTDNSNEPVYSSHSLPQACAKYGELVNPTVYVAYDVKSLKVVAEGSLAQLHKYKETHGITNKLSFMQSRGVK